MGKTKGSMAEYWVGVEKSLGSRLNAVRKYLRHPSSGYNAENYFRDLFREYLPNRYSIESGFVVNEEAERSALMDALIIDRHSVPPLSAEPYFKVFPAEAVVGAIEMTSAAKFHGKRAHETDATSKIERDVAKLAKVRKIARNRQFNTTVLAAKNGSYRLQRSNAAIKLSPRTFLITFGDEWAKASTYEAHLRAALKSAEKKHEAVWVNAVLSMRHGMFVFKPHSDFQPKRYKTNPLLEFILFMNDAISIFPSSPIRLSRYRPTLPVAEDASEE